MRAGRDRASIRGRMMLRTRSGVVKVKLMGSHAATSCCDVGFMSVIIFCIRMQGNWVDNIMVAMFFNTVLE